MPRQIDRLVIDQVKRSELASLVVTRAAAQKRASIITISRSMGSGARIVAEKLAADLGWSLWDRELLDYMAKDANVSRRVVEAFDERSYSDLDMVIHSLVGNKEMAGFIYIRHLVAAVKYIQLLGNAIILGRGANFILPEALNVRIDATEQLRIQNMVDFEGMTQEGAREKIRNSDHDREIFLSRTFGKEMAKACIYDISISMDCFTNESAADIIKTAMKLKQSGCRTPCCKA